jgi:hypothetical protein
MTKIVSLGDLWRFGSSGGRRHAPICAWVRYKWFDPHSRQPLRYLWNQAHPWIAADGGRLPFVHTLDDIGIFARSASDLTRVDAVIRQAMPVQTRLSRPALLGGWFQANLAPSMVKALSDLAENWVACRSWSWMTLIGRALPLFSSRLSKAGEASRVFRRLLFVRRSIRDEQNPEQVFA